MTSVLEVWKSRKVLVWCDRPNTVENSVFTDQRVLMLHGPSSNMIVLGCCLNDPESFITISVLVRTKYDVEVEIGASPSRPHTIIFM